NEKAITDGLMYDLEYANFLNPKFNSHEQFAFFRKYEDEILLIVLNFHDTHLDTEVRIPLEAFQYLNINTDEKYNCVNLLDESVCYSAIELKPNEMFKTQLPPWTGFIFKLTKV
ncbi:MAG: alpha amylase C-terminal domain-containing protein, partial [Paludibacter sp.]|nr:alpha amylase C-terminal domain-containing protein [Paludibacter sp.]